MEKIWIRRKCSMKTFDYTIKDEDTASEGIRTFFEENL